jgi:2-polyprenyl-3-methyl-5-hydroxy-6-metoxy-1,4-benzoquinol methylase
MFCCRICENREKNVSFIAREMMFGFRDEFEYYQCTQCGCLQIKDIPSNISKYYPNTYYSYSSKNNDNMLKSVYMKGKKYLEHQMAKQSLGQENLLGKLFTEKYAFPAWVEWMKIAKLRLNSTILDVGCGAGDLLLEMRRVGFSELTGVDPYLEQELHYENEVKVLKCSLNELEGKYDFIMLNHSFEHMDDPLPTLKNIHRLLSASRFALIRIPVVQCHAWETYGVNWYQLDAPRHFFLHTEKSMEILAAQAGFKVSKIVYDSTGSQFWMSEGYLRGIPFAEQLKSPPFSKLERNKFDEKAKVLNQEGRGDQACFFLQKT